MSAFKKTVVILVLGLGGLAHAKQLATWTIEGHITGIDASADPAFAGLWSRFEVGQDYVATFKVDLDALSQGAGGHAYAPDSSVQFKQAGLTYQLSFIGQGITPGHGGLDLGYGYGALQGGGAHSPALAHAWRFPGAIAASPRGPQPPLWAANTAIQAGTLSLQPIEFGFVGSDLGNLGTHVQASVDSFTTSLDSLTRSAVPEAKVGALALAGGLPCAIVLAVRRRRGGRSGQFDAQQPGRDGRAPAGQIA